jgi:hypothetical protein
VIDLKHEIRRELDQIEPPDLWDRIEADAARLDLTVARDRRHHSVWLAVAAVTVLVALVGALALRDDDQTVDTTPVTEVPDPTTTTAPPTWSGPELDRGAVVHPMTDISTHPNTDPETFVFQSQDPRDAAVDFVDVIGLRFHREAHQWYFDLAGMPPPLLDLEPGMVLTYGVAFDTNADGVADYTAGLSNDTPVRGDFRTWATDLATGQTNEQVGPPYGFPVEFNYADEGDRGYPPDGAPDSEVLLWFLGNDGRSAPPGLNPETARFYVWTALTRDGVLVANDYAPDAGWMSAE